jgi:hypothetical protein
MTISLYLFLCALWIQQDGQLFYGNFAPAPEQARRGTAGISLAFVGLSGVCALADIEDERKARDDGWTIFLVGALITFELALMIATGKPYPSLYFFLSALAGH